jgi:uncharacterized glyoxalase superfamily protein PhnB
MLANRSIPQCTVIPQLAYPDVRRAAAWLCDAFGFSVRIFIGDHRVQLNVGDGAMVVTEQKTPGPQRSSGISVMVRVTDADAHHERARRHGAVILRPPEDYAYGERQYSAEDLNGYVWTFSESIADVEPEDWGGEPVQV